LAQWLLLLPHSDELEDETSEQSHFLKAKKSRVVKGRGKDSKKKHGISVIIRKALFFRLKLKTNKTHIKSRLASASNLEGQLVNYVCRKFILLGFWY